MSIYEVLYPHCRSFIKAEKIPACIIAWGPLAPLRSGALAPFGPPQWPSFSAPLTDMFELFDHRRRKVPRVHLLVRAKHNRCLEEHSGKLFDHLDALPVMAQARIEVPRQREKKSKPSKPGRIALPARTAHVDLKWDKVTVSAPATSQTRNLHPVEVYAL
jgi:hypothetical protein